MRGAIDYIEISKEEPEERSNVRMLEGQSGNVKWSWSIPETVPLSFICIDDRVVVASKGCRTGSSGLVCLDSNTGAELWRWYPEHGANLSRLEGEDGSNPIVLSPGILEIGPQVIVCIGNDQTNLDLVALDLATSTERWRWRPDNGFWVIRAFAQSSELAFVGYRLWHEKDVFAVSALNMQTGVKLWDWGVPPKWVVSDLKMEQASLAVTAYSLGASWWGNTAESSLIVYLDPQQGVENRPRIRTSNLNVQGEAS